MDKKSYMSHIVPMETQRKTRRYMKIHIFYSSTATTECRRNTIREHTRHVCLRYPLVAQAKGETCRSLKQTYRVCSPTVPLLHKNGPR